MPRFLPPKPSRRFLQKQAKDLLKAHKSGNAEACAALRLLHRFRDALDREILDSNVALQEVQLALAMDYGFRNWAELMAQTKSRVTSDKEGSERREQVERSYPGGRRPVGDCSISGRVIDEKTGEPVARATVYLMYNVTHDPLYVTPAPDGSFEFKDIPAGPYSLQVVHARGYQDFSYSPEGKPGKFIPFTLASGEQRHGLVFRLTRSYQISGKVFGEDGKPLKGMGRQPRSDLTVVAWGELTGSERPWKFEMKQQTQLREDGTYLLDNLDGHPVYVAFADFRAEEQDDPYPHCYAPGTFSRDDARLVVFGEKHLVEDVDIAARKRGGLVLEGAVLAADTGKPLPQALIAINRVDMLFDRVTAYSDAEGRFRVECLGAGSFLAHVDATPDGYARTSRAFSLEKGDPPKRLDFSLKRGVTISGNFVNESGKEIAPVHRNTFGSARVYVPEEGNPRGYTGVVNRRASKTVNDHERVVFRSAEGDYEAAQMAFPSANSFLVEGMLPGLTFLSCNPCTEGVAVRAIMYQGKDVRETGFPTKAGDRIEGVSIVLSRPSPDAE